jgi:hypothetical protein
VSDSKDKSRGTSTGSKPRGAGIGSKQRRRRHGRGRGRMEESSAEEEAFENEEESSAEEEAFENEEESSAEKEASKSGKADELMCYTTQHMGVTVDLECSDDDEVLDDISDDDNGVQPMEAEEEPFLRTDGVRLYFFKRVYCKC